MDDKSKRGAPDRDRIDLNDDNEVSNWTRSLNVTREQLEQAVHAVGNSAGKVYDHLGKTRHQ